MFLNIRLYAKCLLLLVTCSSLTAPSNGMIDCSVEGSGDSSFEDICNVTCNTGYQLTGNDTRTCQSDGSWSGSTAMCTRGECLACLLCCSPVLKCFLFH